MRLVVAAQREGPRREHYADLARHWLAMSTWHLPDVPCGSAVWRTPHLTVGVRPDFAVQQADGTIAVVKLWLREQPVSRDAARGCLWLLREHMAELSPGGVPVVVDVRREQAYPVRGVYSKFFGSYLESEAEAMAALWQRLAA